MEQLRRVLASINAALGNMGTTQKLLVSSLVVIALMTLFIVGQYSSTSDGDELLPGASTEVQQAAFNHLRNEGIEARLDNSGSVVVPAAYRAIAMSRLGESRILPNDSTLLFSNLVERQSWQNSRSMNQQNFMIALQNELAHTIGGFRGVRGATVVIDDPEPTGLGRVVRPASASVAVTMEPGRALDQRSVDAIAHVVASSRSGLGVENVRVVDQTNNTQWSASDEQQMHASTYLEHTAARERRERQKLSELLSYIPGVIITVTAQVDVTRVQGETVRYLPQGDGSVTGLVTSETGNSVTERSGSNSAEPGLRSNATADINVGGGGADRPSLETSQTSTELQNFMGTEVRRTVDPRGMPTYLAATINIPEEYVEQLIRRGQAPVPEGEDPPVIERAEVGQRFDELRTQVIASVRPHLRTGTGVEAGLTADNVQVAMVPVGFAQPAGTGTADSGLLGGGGLLAFGSSGLIDTVVVGVLALVALGMMITVVRKSTKKLDLPTAEELVGLPPAIETASDLFGEVEESAGALAAVEVDAGDVEQAQVLEQVSEMIRQNPDSSAKLVQRWVAAED